MQHNQSIQVRMPNSTSKEHTKEPTLDFFRRRNYFGLEEENLVVFEQGMLPCFTFDGKIILETKSQIAKSPGKYGQSYYSFIHREIR